MSLTLYARLSKASSTIWPSSSVYGTCQRSWNCITQLLHSFSIRLPPGRPVGPAPRRSSQSETCAPRPPCTFSTRNQMPCQTQHLALSNTSLHNGQNIVRKQHHRADISSQIVVSSAVHSHYPAPVRRHSQGGQVIKAAVVGIRDWKSLPSTCLEQLGKQFQGSRWSTCQYVEMRCREGISLSSRLDADP